MNEIIIGTKIADGRKKRGLSQAKFAEMLCMSAQAVGKWERGESMPDIMMFGKIAEAIGTDLNYFLDIETKDEKKEEDKKKNDQKQKNKDMSYSQWKGGDFSGLKNAYGKLGCSNVEDNKFVEADLSGIAFKMNNIDKNDFSKANFQNCKFNMANVDSNNFTEADFTDSIFSNSNIDTNNFSKANFTNVQMKNCNFDINNVNGTIFEETEFKNTKFKLVSFTSDMNNCSFINCVFRKSGYKNMTFRNTFFKEVRLKGVSFTNCKADRITYSFLANCRGTDLSGIEVID